MDKEKIITYIENSFIKDILLDNDITDITYNGKYLYIQKNTTGRSRSGLKVTNNEVKDFLRQISNMAEKQFNYLYPLVDINVGRYRINMTNSSVARRGDEEVYNFAIRLASLTPKITYGSGFLCDELEGLFDLLISNKISIIISGLPGVGKTEFQKYLMSKIEEDSRVIVIDSTIELMYISNVDKLDISYWKIDENNPLASVSSLVKNGLRNNPDWMIISEARGSEMSDVLTSLMTGIPLITTIHSFDAFTSSNRLAKMVMMNEKKMDYEDVINNINDHLKIYVHLSKIVKKNEPIIRYISSIVEVDELGKKHEIFSDNLKSKKFAKLSKNFLDHLLINNKDKRVRRFISHE